MDPRTNPYAPGAGTPPPELSGRDELIERAAIALDRIRAGRSARSFILYGLRGVGKTVLLNRIRLDAEARGFESVKIEAPEEDVYKRQHGKLPFARGGGRLPPVPPGSRSPFPASLLSAQATGFPARPQSVTKDGGAPKVRGSTRFSCACADLPHRSLNESTNSRTQIGRV